MRRRQILMERQATVEPAPEPVKDTTIVLCPKCRKAYKKRGLGKHMQACGG